MTPTRPTALAAAALSALALAGCAHNSNPSPAPHVTAPANVTPSSPANVASNTPLSLGATTQDMEVAKSSLGSLPVKGLAPKTGYSRSQFGPSWTDSTTAPMSHNGCDTRNDIINRDLSNKTWKDNKHCVVMSGTFAVEPYTGKAGVSWVKSSASTLQVDHIFPLSAAWQHGAQQWSKPLREAFANDPGNLALADGPLNAAKGDSTPAAWMPPNKASWCSYAVKFVATTAKYDKLAKAEDSRHGLWVSQADKDMLGRALAMCPA